MKLPIRVTEDSKEPIYHQIEQQIKMLIVGGHLSPGTLLPSIRALSNDLSCSVITTRRAYHNLENDGYIKTVQGKGTFVSTVDHKMESEIRMQMVFASFQKAVEQGKQIGCTVEELKSIFEQVLKEYEDRGKGRE